MNKFKLQFLLVAIGCFASLFQVIKRVEKGLPSNSLVVGIIFLAAFTTYCVRTRDDIYVKTKSLVATLMSFCLVTVVYLCVRYIYFDSLTEVVFDRLEESFSICLLGVVFIYSFFTLAVIYLVVNFLEHRAS